MLPLYLASKSERRFTILKELGINFTVIPNLLNEETLERKHGRIRNQLKHLCLRKALHSINDLKGWLLTADTIIYFNEMVIGKPQSRTDAIKTLSLLSNQSHQVITACCLYNTISQKHYFCSDSAEVTFNELSLDEIKYYIDSKKPFDKAGSYGIQDIPEGFLKNLKGHYSTVLGLPRPKIKLLLKHIYT
tara:strand:- start:232 stop:801 length:570 start_codon:yes stop_codon:yes gene_type:complete